MPAAYAYYPGCTQEGSAKEYDESARLVCKELGIDLKEIEGWTCCGASSAHTTNHLLSVALPARELQAAEEMGLPIAVVCAMCYSRLKFASHELTDPKTMSLVSEVLEKNLQNTTEIVHLLEILDKQTIPIRKLLHGLKVACYYGCILARPEKVTHFDDEENPQMMDRLINNLGAEAVDWGYKTECCGASLPLTRPDILRELSHRILQGAQQSGADCIAVACPMCHSNLDMQQKSIRDKYGDQDEIPIVYFTQLVGLAMGLSHQSMLLDRHFVDPVPTLREKGAI